MSEQRHAVVSEPQSFKLKPNVRPAARYAGLRQRLPFYAAGIAVAIIALAWIQGGEEPLHPITQAVELPPSKGERG